MLDVSSGHPNAMDSRVETFQSSCIRVLEGFSHLKKRFSSSYHTVVGR